MCLVTARRVVLACLMCPLLDGAKRSLKMVRRPYGPQMCRRICVDSAEFYSYVEDDLSCRLRVGSINMEEHSIKPSFTCRKADSLLKENTSSNLQSANHTCPTRTTGTGAPNKLSRIITRQDTTRKIACHRIVDLYQASSAGNIIAVRNILSQRLDDINCRGKYGRTPLMAAARKGRLTVFNFLLGQGSDLAAVDDHGNTVLHVAVKGGSTRIVKTLLCTGYYQTEIRGAFDRTALMIAAYYGHGSVFDLLVSKGYDLNVQDNQTNNILHAACSGGNVHIVKQILSKGILDKDRGGYFGWTPLMSAARYGQREVLELLVSEGCNLTQRDNLGNAVLHLACVGGHAGVVKDLLAQELVTGKEKNSYGETPIQIAEMLGYRDVVLILKETRSQV